MSTATASQSPSNVPAKQDIKSLLESRKGQITEIVPSFMAPDRVIRLATLAIYKNPDLLKCSHASILQSVMEATALGLEIGGPLAQAHLIPYGTVCQFIPDYKGLLELARRSGHFEVIEAREVYERDTFDLRYTPFVECNHVPCLDGNPGKIVRVYAYAKLKTGEIAFETMTDADVEKIRLGSRSANSPAWKNHRGEMSKKVVLKRFLKRQARSVEVAQAIEADDREYHMDGEHGGHSAPRRGTAALSARLGIGHDEPTLPPQPSLVYSEADDELPPDADLETTEAGSRG